jgi:hypothetical protein
MTRGNWGSACTLRVQLYRLEGPGSWSVYTPAAMDPRLRAAPGHKLWAFPAALCLAEPLFEPENHHR